MKTCAHLATFAAIATGAVLLASPVYGGGGIDFTRFKGTYKGNLSIVFQGYPYSGPAKVRFKVPRSGRTAKVLITGKVSTDTVVPVRALVALKPRGKVRVSKIDLGNNIPVPTAKGKYKKNGRSGLKGTALTSIAGQDLGFSCAVKVKGSGRARKLNGDFGMTLRGNQLATVSLKAKG
jgi:hypothetical protein